MIIMRKKLSYVLILTFLLLGIEVYPQAPKISSSLPSIAPPSPTVSGLMKFEEIPVDNYTGVPNISIPLYSVQTRSQDIAISLSLNYHSMSIAADEIAGYAGLGWNLLAGGTISRTVRGLPDEINTISPKKLGIYKSGNPYYSYESYDDIPTNSDPNAEKYFWETSEKGFYDTEHDLYQYNFMGHSGRFYVRANNQVIKLDNDNALRIIYDGNAFVITDDKGYKYTFDQKEMTNSTSVTISGYFFGAFGDIFPGNDSALNYVSAYHLSKIEDNTTSSDANLLAIFNYFATTYPETAYDITETTNWIDGYTIDRLNTTFLNGCTEPVSAQYRNIEPERILNTTTRTTATKKIESIFIPNKTKIYFTLSSGRQDKANGNLVATHRLQEVTINDWANVQVKKYKLYHSYSETRKNYKRMMLDSITENDTQSYKLFYRESFVDNASEDLGVDHWGFFNLRPANQMGGLYREASSSTCATDVLSQMQLPTGGFINYEFEPNDYSYDGDIRLEDFTENPDRFLPASASISLTERRSLEDQTLANPFFLIDDEQDVVINTSTNSNSGNWLVKITNYNMAEDYGGISANQCSGNSNLCFDKIRLKSGWYFTYFDELTIGLPSNLYYNVYATYLQRNPETYYRKYLIGGGIRIKSISYVDNGNVLGTKNYNYNFAGERNRSSGSLAFPKPLYEYNRSVRHSIMKKAPCNFIERYFFETYPKISYKTTTTFNSLKPLNTRGGYVGYKNVTVSQNGYTPGANSYEVTNGKTQYTYTSPIDEPIRNYDVDNDAKPNPKYVIHYPFFKPDDHDYRRGILKSEKTYNEYDKLLTETNYDYVIKEDSLISGITIYSDDCPFGKQSETYEAYMSKLTGCIPGPDVICYTCGDPDSYIHYVKNKDNFGWVQLTGKITKSYFYDKYNNTKTVDVKETFSYHDTNKKILSYSKETYNKVNTIPEKISESYVYLLNSTVSAQNDISKMQYAYSFVNGEQTANQNIDYSNALSPGNPDYLPNIIKDAKGTATAENKLRFNRYDIFGSPIEVTRENGTPIVYLYDANHHNVIAVIENATYAQVVSFLGVMPVLGYSESNMVAINNLRTQLPLASIITYTYKPLVGVATSTDARGQVTTYNYDAFGRLIKVTDAQNNIISENVYKYRNQN